MKLPTITGHYSVGVLLETCLADVSCTSQGAICSAPDSEGRFLKHYSHIRLEAKRDALESIVKKQPKTNAPGQSNRRRKGSLQMTLHGLQNGSMKLNGNQAAAYAENTLKQKI